ncbi:tetratricopeptide repeat protein [Rickettsia hoogstraalii]
MKNIKKLVLIFILPLIYNNIVLAKDLTNFSNKQQIVQHNTVQDPNILAEEYFNIGESFYKLGKYQEAIKNYDLAIKYKPEYANAYNNKGIVLDDLG